MSIFTEAEMIYLRSQPLMRFASASLSGRPDVAPVIYQLEGDVIITAGFNIAETVRYRNVLANPQVTVVIDDLASVDPWTPRGIKATGICSIENVDGNERFHISPKVIISWGINDTTPGIPKMERRVVA